MFHYTLLLLSKFRGGFQKETAVSSVRSETRLFPYSSAVNSSPLASSLHGFMILGEDRDHLGEYLLTMLRALGSTPSTAETACGGTYWRFRG